nr:MAG TPA: hypothetical protein [Caudoviricetes sp.]
MNGYRLKFLLGERNAPNKMENLKSQTFTRYSLF